MSLRDVRKEIDDIDGRILRLLDLRFACALRTRRFKAGVADPRREAEILRSVARRAGSLTGPKAVVRIYREILARSRDIQRNVDRLRRNDHEDRHHRRRKDGRLAGPGAPPRPRRRRP